MRNGRINGKAKEAEGRGLLVKDAGFAPRNTESNIRKEFPDGRFENLCDSQQGFDGDDLLSTLDFPEVFGIQIGKLSQFLLRKMRGLAMGPYRLTDRLPVRKNRLVLFLRAGHVARTVGGRGFAVTPAICWLFSLPSSQRGVIRQQGLDVYENASHPGTSGE
jgi:hypothetical protein